MYSLLLTMYLFGFDLWRLHFILARFLFFLFFFPAVIVDFSPVNSALVHCSQDSQTPLFSNFFIKNWSHGTIHTFKNYFTIVFSVFSKNKLYPNGPYVIYIYIAFLNQCLEKIQLESKLEFDFTSFRYKLNCLEIFFSLN